MNPNLQDTSFRTCSRDEMNLVEFPISVLSKRAQTNVKTLEFTDFITSRTGEHVERKWIITGADKFGLPTSSDDEVLLGLIKLSVDRGLASRKIHFTRYELLRVLKWSTEGRSYSRLQRALDRLSGLRIKTVNGFFDNDSKRHTTKNFGLIDEYEINSYIDGDHPSSFFVWSDVLFRSFQVGFIKKIDLDFYLELKSAVAKRLFRYLDKHFWYRGTVSRNLFALCHDKIGVSRNFKYASSLLQQLEPGVEELKAKGFLRSVETTGKGKYTEILFCSVRTVEPSETTSPLSSVVSAGTSIASAGGRLPATANRVDLDSTFSDGNIERGNAVCQGIVKNLVSRGLRESQAVRLTAKVNSSELEKAELIIKYFDYLVAKRSRLISRSPVGFLFKAIESVSHFVVPAFFIDMQKTAENAVVPKVHLGVPKKAISPEVKNEESLTGLDTANLRANIDPVLLKSVEKEVEAALAKMRGIISESRFNEVVRHGVDKKLLKMALERNMHSS
jgi:plasmid replication initiation protein